MALGRKCGTGGPCAAGFVPFQGIRQFAESFAGTWDLEYQQLGAANRQGWCRFAKDDSGLVYEEQYAAAIGLRGTLADGLFAVHLTDECGRRGGWQGGHAPESALAYADARVELDLVIPQGAHNVAVVLPLELAAERIERLTGEPHSRLLPGDRLFRVIDPNRRRHLVAELKQLLREPPAAGGLGMAVVECVSRAMDGAPKPAGSPTRAARRVFRRGDESLR